MSEPFLFSEPKYKKGDAEWEAAYSAIAESMREKGRDIAEYERRFPEELDEMIQLHIEAEEGEPGNGGADDEAIS